MWTKSIQSAGGKTAALRRKENSLIFYRDKVLIENSIPRVGWTLKRALLALGYVKDFSCSNCGWMEVNPHTGSIPTEVDHIDGNRSNNSPQNLRLLCPNCHSLTKTYCGANMKRKKNDQVE